MLAGSRRQSRSLSDDGAFGGSCRFRSQAAVRPGAGPVRADPNSAINPGRPGSIRTQDPELARGSCLFDQENAGLLETRLILNFSNLRITMNLYYGYL